MKSITQSTGKRFKFETRLYTEEQRAKMKELHIQQAMEWEPPETYLHEIELNPGDEGYDDAHLEQVATYYLNDETHPPSPPKL